MQCLSLSDKFIVSYQHLIRHSIAEMPNAHQILAKTGNSKDKWEGGELPLREVPPF